MATSICNNIQIETVEIDVNNNECDSCVASLTNTHTYTFTLKTNHTYTI